MLNNKNLFITGVGKGIGRSLLFNAINNNAFIFGLTRSKTDYKNLKKLKLKNCKIYLGDVRNMSLIKKIFHDSLKQKKPINSLVNNAGIRQRKKFNKIKSKDLKEIFEINFFSIFYILQFFIKFLKKNKILGSVVNIGSIVGQRGFEDLSGYASTKGALTSLTKCLASEYLKNNCRINVINPGFIKTSYYLKFKQNKTLYNWTKKRNPMLRWGNPEEISNLICFLLSEKSSYINGQAISIDGGWTSV